MGNMEKIVWIHHQAKDAGDFRTTSKSFVCHVLKPTSPPYRKSTRLNRKSLKRGISKFSCYSKARRIRCRNYYCLFGNLYLPPLHFSAILVVILGHGHAQGLFPQIYGKRYILLLAIQNRRIGKPAQLRCQPSQICSQQPPHIYDSRCGHYHL